MFALLSPRIPIDTIQQGLRGSDLCFRHEASMCFAGGTATYPSLALRLPQLARFSIVRSTVELIEGFQTFGMCF